MLFSHLLGNERVKVFLTKMLEEERVPHALLFSGREGIGKILFATAFAFAFMKIPLRKEHQEHQKYQEHPDLHIYRGEGKSGAQTISSIRDLIAEVALTPFEAKKKVFIIEDADRMLPTSSHAVLKTLEEPPLDTLIILISSHPDQLLPTISSRCQRISFSPLTPEEIASFIQENWKIDSAAERERLAFFSQGSIGRAQLMIKEEENERGKNLLDLLLKARNPLEIKKCLITLEKGLDIEDKSLDQIDLILEKIAFWYRDLYFLSLGIDTKQLFYRDHLKELKVCLEERPPPALQKVLYLIDRCRLAASRHIKLSTFLDYFFLNL